MVCKLEDSAGKLGSVGRRVQFVGGANPSGARGSVDEQVVVRRGIADAYIGDIIQLCKTPEKKKVSAGARNHTPTRSKLRMPVFVMGNEEATRFVVRVSLERGSNFLTRARSISTIRVFVRLAMRTVNASLDRPSLGPAAGTAEEPREQARRTAASKGVREKRIVGPA